MYNAWRHNHTDGSRKISREIDILSFLPHAPPTRNTRPSADTPAVRLPSMHYATPWLFLDVDGVLHRADAATPADFFEHACMTRLQRIVCATRATIVLTSSWRTDEELVTRLNAALVQYGMQPIMACTRQHAPPDLSLPEDLRLSLGIIRAREISEWRQEGSRREAAFAVLDDLCMGADVVTNRGHPACYELEDHLVTTCPVHGVSDADADAAVTMLLEDDTPIATDHAVACSGCNSEAPSEAPTRLDYNNALPASTSRPPTKVAAAYACQVDDPLRASTAAAPRTGAATIRLPNELETPQLSITATGARTVHARFTCVEPRAVVEASAASHSWVAGARVASEREPRLVLYPNFLSSKEVDHLLDLAHWGAMEAAAAASFTSAPKQAVSWDGARPAKTAQSGRTISIHLPPPGDDAIIQSIEERCALVTGIPMHAAEEPLGLRQTSASTADECEERFCTALHVDTNQGGHFRAATVLLYLHDVPIGGETRFPLVGVTEPSELRDAAERLADLGVTAFSPSEAVEWPPLELRQKLLDAAETTGSGLHVQPKRGLAAVFWTHTANGLDQYSWHAGARLPPEAVEGKLIAQKFKSLPLECRPKRRGDKVRLPAEMSPPVVAAH